MTLNAFQSFRLPTSARSPRLRLAQDLQHSGGLLVFDELACSTHGGPGDQDQDAVSEGIDQLECPPPTKPMIRIRRGRSAARPEWARRRADTTPNSSPSTSAPSTPRVFGCSCALSCGEALPGR